MSGTGAAARLVLTVGQRAELGAIAVSPSLSYRAARQARALLDAADGVANEGTAPEVTTWLAHPRQARWHLHFTPTSSSWLNLAERWFKKVTDQRLRRGTFTSVAELIEAITGWTDHGNTNPVPFVWHAAACDIIAKVQRGRDTLSGLTTAPPGSAGRR